MSSKEVWVSYQKSSQGKAYASFLGRKEEQITMETKNQAVWSPERGLKYLRPNVSFETYREKYPNAKAVKVPSQTVLARWVEDGVAGTIDGCRTEPDGKCPHGFPSWLLALGYI